MRNQAMKTTEPVSESGLQTMMEHHVRDLMNLTSNADHQRMSLEESVIRIGCPISDPKDFEVEYDRPIYPLMESISYYMSALNSISSRKEELLQALRDTI